VLVLHKTVIPFIDLRVDDHPDPVAELRRVYQVAVTEGNGEELAFYVRVSSQEGAAEDPAELP
jgi:uncharacterized Ntn-hydrolase superfamily protein